MNDLERKLLAYLTKHADVEELLKQSSVVDTSSPHVEVPLTPDEMSRDQLGRKVKDVTVPKRAQIRQRKQETEIAAPSQGTAPSAPSKPSDSPWRELPEGMQRRYRKGMHPGGGPYSGTVVDVVPKEKKKPDYSQGSPSMHPGGGAYTSKQLRTLVKDFLREYDI